MLIITKRQNVLEKISSDLATLTGLYKIIKRGGRSTLKREILQLIFHIIRRGNMCGAKREPSHAFAQWRKEENVQGRGDLFSGIWWSFAVGVRCL